MFERFTKEARDAVARSQDEARLLGHPFIGSEHLLISIADGSGPGAQVLSSRGIAASALRRRLGALSGEELDADALAALGIDLARVLEATEANLGPGALAPKRAPMPSGHLRFTKRGKKILELALREAMRLHSGEISSGHLLLGLLREAESGDHDDLAARLLNERALDFRAMRAETERLIVNRAA